ncbi:hypothetical protein BJV82DRAFT_582917 [Fennellomyces sp. T-0311]|nr:hypothetical protein BJV82DRAFT_582917 [Fennellomyces sp. T-0311]
MNFQSNMSFISKAISSVKLNFNDLKINLDEIPIGTKIAVAAVTLLGLLSLKYNDRAVFTKRRKDVPFIKGALLLINSADRVYDDIAETFERMDTLTMAQSIIGLPPQIMTIDPLNIEYVLKHNTPNYVKGQQMLDAMGDLFGHAIFTSNGDTWKYQRKTASHIFNVLTLRDHFTE